MKPSQIDVTLQMGKSGPTDTFVEELRQQLKKRKTVKVRFLRSAKDASTTRELAAEIARRIGAIVRDVRGNTAVFAEGLRPPSGRKPVPPA